jgi:hypothetical protein
MIQKLAARRWSTLTLVGLSLGLCGLTWFMGRATKPALVSAPALRPETTTSPETTANSAPTIQVSEATSEPLTRWTKLSATALTPASEQARTEFLAELAAHNPRLAMQMALDETNQRLRLLLRQTVLRAWATQTPEDAAAWAMILPDGDRQVAMEAVLTGAATQPDDAIRLVRQLSALDPERASAYGQFLVTGLTASGAYAEAARFAAAETSVTRAAWLHTAFFQWATHQPDNARAAFELITDPTVRSAAFPGFISGWGLADPAALAAYAIKLPPGEDRAQALAQALPQWVAHDTMRASEWMNRLEPHSDLDSGVASVATLSSLVNERPDIAVGWAENIAEPVLRSNTLWLLAQQWAHNDPDALRRYLTTTPNLTENDRTALNNGLSGPPGG